LVVFHPQLERFLIDNRDDYLKFSSRNYTVEQKQFNNMLTERLIALAEKHCYIFDPEDFNFVAIRDRIRCYYKSYVQTARKRGHMLPTDKSTSGLPTNATSTMATTDEDDDDDDHHTAADEPESNDAEGIVEIDAKVVTTSVANNEDVSHTAETLSQDQEVRE
jgi:hypothetical protein